MCYECLANHPTLRLTYDELRKALLEPRYSSTGITALELAPRAGLHTVEQLASFASNLDIRRVNVLQAEDLAALCRIARDIIGHATERSQLRRAAESILLVPDSDKPVTTAEVLNLENDLRDSAKTVVEQRICNLRAIFRDCKTATLRQKITESPYRIVAASEGAAFDAVQLLPLYWLMHRPAFWNPIGVWERPALKLVQENVRRAITTGVVYHDDNTWAGAIPRLETIRVPDVRAALMRLLGHSERMGRIIDLFYEPYYDSLVMRLEARAWDLDVTTYLSVERNRIVEIMNALLAGWAEPLPMARTLGHLWQTDGRTTEIPRRSDEDLTTEFDRLWRLGLDSWYERQVGRRAADTPKPASRSRKSSANRPQPALTDSRP